MKRYKYAVVRSHVGYQIGRCIEIILITEKLLVV